MTTKLTADDNEKAGLTTLTQWGVRMPNGRERWVTDVTGPHTRIAIPGVQKRDGWGTARDAAVELVGAAVKDQSISLAEANKIYKRGIPEVGAIEVPDIVRIKRTITIVVGETELVPEPTPLPESPTEL